MGEAPPKHGDASPCLTGTSPSHTGGPLLLGGASLVIGDTPLSEGETPPGLAHPSANLPRFTKPPSPAVPTYLPPSTTTFPRCITQTGAPVTSLPSYGE